MGRGFDAVGGTRFLYRNNAEMFWVLGVQDTYILFEWNLNWQSMRRK